MVKSSFANISKWEKNHSSLREKKMDEMDDIYVWTSQLEDIDLKHL